MFEIVSMLFLWMKRERTADGGEGMRAFRGTSMIHLLIMFVLPLFLLSGETLAEEVSTMFVPVNVAGMMSTSTPGETLAGFAPAMSKRQETEAQPDEAAVISEKAGQGEDRSITSLSGKKSPIQVVRTAETSAAGAPETSTLGTSASESSAKGTDTPDTGIPDTDNLETETASLEEDLSQGVDAGEELVPFLDLVEESMESVRPFSVSLPVDSRAEETRSDAARLCSSSLQAISENQLISAADYETLLDIVEAECTGGDEQSKMLVANVILNRTADPRFPNNVTEVVYQKSGGMVQFSPTVDGRMGTLPISDTTISAVNKALQGENIAQGALFFVARNGASASTLKWFDQELVFLYSYGGHDFYKFETS